jgi:transcriptional regulator with XRE-family HTH domain
VETAIKRVSSKALGERLREEKKLSRKQLADSIGVDPSRLFRIESGAGTPTIDQFFSLSAALSISFNGLVRAESPEWESRLAAIMESVKANTEAPEYA